MLNLILLAGMIGNVVGIYVKYWILYGHYFRWTNLILIGQSVQFIVTPLIWYLIADGPDSCTRYGFFVLVMPVMGVMLLICYAWGRYYANKLEYARTI